MLFLKNKFVTFIIFSGLLSGCSVVEATYDIVTLPIVIVGEAAEGVANVISDDDDDEDKDDDKNHDNEEESDDS